MNQGTKSMIGRARELGELDAGLDEASSGSGGLFLLVGEPGIGKTRVAEEAARRAKERGFSVHWGRCWEVGGSPAFWPWIQIFRSMLRDPRNKAIAGAYGEILSRLLPELRSPESHPQELEHAQARFQLFDELWALLRAVAEQAPLLIVLDDLHAADPSSLALLRFVVRDLRTSRVVIVTTYRDRDARPVAEVTDTIRAITRDGTFLPLRRLDIAEVQQFLEERTEAPVPTGLATALHKATEGNPLFVDQVFRMLKARADLGAPSAPLPIPEGILEMIKKRLATVVGPARDLLDAAAIIGREFTRPLLAAVCEQEEASLRGSLDELLESGIVVEPVLGTYEFAHALFREALYRDLPSAQRAKLHARVASAFEVSGAAEKSLGEIAQHLLAAISVVGPARALAGSLEAGQRALDSLAFEDAVTILSTALKRVGASQEHDRLRGQALVMLGKAHAQAGSHDDARKACEEAAAMARRNDDPELLAEAALALGIELVPGVITKSLVTLLEEAKSKLPDAPSALRARVLARLAAALQPAMDPEGPMIFAREAVAMARALGDDGTVRACLHMGGAALVDYADPAERCVWDSALLRLSLDAGDVIASLRAHTRLVFDYLELGRPEEADVHIAAHGRLADEHGLPRYQWLTLMLRSMRAISEGRFDESELLRERARRIRQRVKAAELDVAFYIQSWGSAIAMGGPLPNVQEVIEATAHFPHSEDMGFMVRIFEHARRGEHEPARALISGISMDHPFLSCFGPHSRFLSEACARLHDGQRASRIYQALLPLENRMWSWGRVGLIVEGPVSWLLGMLATAMERWDVATRHFDDAIQKSMQARTKPYEAITCLEYARMLARRGAGYDAKRDEVTQRGAAIARDLGFDRLVTAFADLTSPVAPPTAPSAEASNRPTSATPSFTLQKEGELWSFESSGRTFRLKDSRGVQMLAELLFHPGREFHVLTLSGSDAVDTGDAGEVIDKEAARAYREHVEDLRDQIAEAESWGDGARAEGLRNKLETIAAELSRGMGLGGRSRRSGAAAERARVNVQRRLRDSIRRIGEQDPGLGRHLDRSVRTGTFCAYEPD
jgi:tetratricopeptide (TPR) repeat protein